MPIAAPTAIDRSADAWYGAAMPTDPKLARVAEALRAAGTVLVGTGAGMGVDSGLPDFRGRDGFWRAYPQAKALNLSFEDMASPRTFHDDPALAWGFYGHRLNLYRATAPHRGYAILAQAFATLRARGGDAAVFTSNVDGHHARAGHEVVPVVECHGSIHRWQCLGSCHEGTWPAGDVAVDVQAMRAVGELPRCPRCGASARPNLLMFGDAGWIGADAGAQQRRFAAWLARPRRGPALALEFGAGTAIPTVRQVCARFARERGGLHVRINPDEEPADPAVLHLRMGALAALGALAELGAFA